jgi:hypothetical protein
MVRPVNENLVSVGNVLGPPSADTSRPVRFAASAINRVHNVPGLARLIPVVGDAAMMAGGKYRWEKDAGMPVDIRINPRSDHPELTTVLEVGHLLDHQAIGEAGEFASLSHPRLAEWRKAIDSTRVVQKLEDLREARSIPFRFSDGVIRQTNIGGIAEELLELPELFSRSYAQLISKAARSAKLAAQIRGFRRPGNPSSVVPCYWDCDDFEAVARAFESLIMDLG